MPGSVPVTSTHALNQVTLPYIRKIAKKFNIKYYNEVSQIQRIEFVIEENKDKLMMSDGIVPKFNLNYHLLIV